MFTRLLCERRRRRRRNELSERVVVCILFGRVLCTYIRSLKSVVSKNEALLTVDDRALVEKFDGSVNDDADNQRDIVRLGRSRDHDRDMSASTPTRFEVNACSCRVGVVCFLRAHLEAVVGERLLGSMSLQTSLDSICELVS